MGEPYGVRCLYFDLDGRPASAFSEQKLGITERGYLSVFFEDGQDSSLPVVSFHADDDLAKPVVAQGTNFLYSPWLVERMRELARADKFEDGRSLGDAPEGE
jgi:hypothetical protein